MKKKEHAKLKIAAGLMAGAFLVITVSDGKTVVPWNRPVNDCAIELNCDVPSYRPGYDVRILDLHAHSSTGASYTYVAHMSIDDAGIFYKV